MTAVFFLCLLLLAAKHVASSHANYYKLGSGQVFYKTPGKSSSGNSQQASTLPPDATTCTSSSIATEGNNKVPVVHRKSPCSPLHGLPSLTPGDVLRRDFSRIRRRFSSAVASPASSSMDFFFPGDPSMLPVLDYSVFVNYGTPEEQRLPVYLDTVTGFSQLKCNKPFCASASEDHCEPASFNTSRSLTFSKIPCDSPDCPVNYNHCFATSVCQYIDMYRPRVWGTFSQDVLTLTTTIVVDDFRFLCLNGDIKGAPDDQQQQPQAGTLDLSRDRNSLPSRLSSPAFSYCLPQSPSSEGYLYLNVNTTVDTEDDNRTVVHAPLVSHEDEEPSLARAYFIELVGIRLGGTELPIPADALGDVGANLDVGTTYTLLSPAAYAPLRDAFRKEMSRYNCHNCSLPGRWFDDGFDTCYNFTALDKLFIPFLRLEFGNGENLLIDWDQLMYYEDPVFAPFTVACLAFSAWNDTSDDDGSAPLFSVIGTYQLASMEVVYDVAGGNVGFISDSC